MKLKNYFNFLRIYKVWRYKIYRKIKSKFLKIIKQDNNSHSIAMGFAIGIFIGMFPIVGQMFLALLIASLFRFNTIAAVSSVWITNPFTMLPIFSFSYLIGSFFYDPNQIIQFHDFKEMILHLNIKTLFSKGTNILYPLFTGSFILATTSSFLTYFVSKKLIKIITPHLIRRKK